MLHAFQKKSSRGIATTKQDIELIRNRLKAARNHHQRKAKLTLHIYRIIKSRKLTQVEAGGILGIKQPHVSALMRNRTGNFSIGRLMHFLTALGQDVEISVKPAPKRRGHGELLVYVQ